MVKFVVTPELFSTKHRAVAVGSATVWTRIGGECVVGRRSYRKGRQPIWTRCAQLCGVLCPTTAVAILHKCELRKMCASQQSHNYKRVPGILLM